MMVITQAICVIGRNVTYTAPYGGTGYVTYVSGGEESKTTTNGCDGWTRGEKLKSLLCRKKRSLSELEPAMREWCKNWGRCWR